MAKAPPTAARGETLAGAVRFPEPDLASAKTARTRRSPLRAMPRPLRSLLLVVALFGSAWSVINPAFQGPDETAHFAYVQTLVENGRLPGIPGRPMHSTELTTALERTNHGPMIFFTYGKPEWSASKEAAWEAEQASLARNDGGGPSSTSGTPPLYYAYESIFYRAAGSGDIFARLLAMRLGSMLLLLVATIGAWLLAGELFARRRVPQLVVAATVGLWTMTSFVSASINPDAMAIALWTLALWLGVRLLRSELTPGLGIAFGATVGAALVVKASALALLPAALCALAWAGFVGLRGRRPARWRVALALAAALAALALPTLLWSAAVADRPALAEASWLGDAGKGGGFNAREFLSYMWQFYLPRLSFMTDIDHHVPIVSQVPLLNTWIGMGWAVFGWVTLWFPKWVYLILAAVSGLVVMLVLNAAVRWWREEPRSARLRALPPALFVATVGLTLLAALHWTDYGWYVAERGLFLQGRYLLPAIGVAAVAVAFAFDRFPLRQARLPLAAAWLALLIVVQLASLGLNVDRWYV